MVYVSGIRFCNTPGHSFGNRKVSVIFMAVCHSGKFLFAIFSTTRHLTEIWCYGRTDVGCYSVCVDYCGVCVEGQSLWLIWNGTKTDLIVYRCAKLLDV
jgi:hypothetical protein